MQALEAISCPSSPEPSLHAELVRAAIATRYGFRVSESWFGQLTTRLEQQARMSHRANIADYVQWLLSDSNELARLVESFLIGETHFLRTEPHFMALTRKVINPWRTRQPRGERLRIASLGCSTGEEPYSIAMIVCETLTPGELEEVEITGADVSTRALAAARQGRYDLHQLRELSPARRNRWFSPLHGQWQVSDFLKSRVRFLHHNLLRPLPFAGLDAVFCRNVLIYFAPEQVAACLREIHSALRPGGYLILGHSETALGHPERFEPVPTDDTIIYQSKTLTAPMS